MNEKIWNMYLESLQGHPSICSSSHTKESLAFIRDKLPLPEFKKMLDIGAGEGLESHILSELGYKVTAIVGGKVNFDYAKKNFPEVDFHLVDMHILPFSAGSFDCVYMDQVFEHSFAPFIFLLELNYVLRDKGRIWIRMPRFFEYDDLRAAEVNRISHHHPNILCKNLYIQFFEKTGFNILEGEKVQSESFNDNVYLLEKDNSKLHSDVLGALERRKKWNEC